MKNEKLQPWRAIDCSTRPRSLPQEMCMRLLSILLIPAVLTAAVNYSYDAAGRLTKVDYGASGSINYTYDKAGNLLSRVVASGAATGGTITRVNTAFVDPSQGIAQNSWTEIHGTNLVPATTPSSGVIWNSAPEFAQGRMPTQIGGLSVTVNGKPAFIYYFCSSVTSAACADDQINILTPLDTTTGNVNVVVTSATGTTAPFIANMVTRAPSLFRFDTAGHIVATHLDYSLIGPASLYPGASTPAKPGESIVVYGTGFGLPTGTINPGSSSQSGSLATLPVCTVGTDQAAVAFAGLVGPGLFQLNLTVPTTAAKSDDPITCTYAGSSTQPGNLLTVQ
jgi:uncharacterized protein (TIGR03437 family)